MTLLSYVFQSTRPCGARQAFPFYTYAMTFVSIHAPLRGATGRVMRPKGITHVSIHAPLRGATYFHRCATFRGLRFNPRAPAGRDCPRTVKTTSDASFNPRAPAGRDGSIGDRLKTLSGFNPRAPAGRDQSMVMGRQDYQWFQSTRPCGARRQ